MGLTTQNPYIQKEPTELYKILKFRVNWANIEQDRAIQKLQNLQRNVWTPRGRVPLVPCGRETRTSGIIHFSATEIVLSAQLRRCELILENGCRNGSETADHRGYVPRSY